MCNKYTFSIIFLVCVSFMACTPKDFVGKFSERNDSCILLEYVDVLPDRTVLSKYISIRDEVQFNAKFYGDTLEIPEQQRTWYFKLKNDTLYEISNIDYRCFLVRDAK